MKKSAGSISISPRPLTNVSKSLYYVKINGKGEFWHKDVDCNIQHRVFGPALLNFHGGEYWFQDGELHRVGGPAVTHTNKDGCGRYFLNGYGLTKQEYDRVMLERNIAEFSI